MTDGTSRERLAYLKAHARRRVDQAATVLVFDDTDPYPMCGSEIVPGSGGVVDHTRRNIIYANSLGRTPTTVAFVADVYRNREPLNFDPEDGELAALLAAGDHRITEAVTVVTVTGDDTTNGWWLNYTRHDDNTITFDDQLESAGPRVHGPAVEQVIAGWTGALS